MLYKDIEIGKTYRTQSLGKIVEVKVTAKVKTKNYYRVEYDYSEPTVFGCTKGWQFSKYSHKFNFEPVD